MLDAAAIVVSVISLVTALGVALMSGIFTFRIDEHKAVREAERLLRKYREPLLLAAQELQARLFNILDRSEPGRSVLYFAERSEVYQDTIFVYTAYLVGQYLAWTNILRRQVQFTAFTTEEKQPRRTREFIEVLDNITAVLNKGWQLGASPEQEAWRRLASSDRNDVPYFILFKGHQRAIGEIMTVRDNSSADGELFCMGYSDFTKKWKMAERSTGIRAAQVDWIQSGIRPDHWDDRDKAEIIIWFLPIISGIHALVRARQRGDDEVAAENTLRVLQHLLVDLVQMLDPKRLRPGSLREREKSVAEFELLGCWCKSCRPPQRQSTLSAFLGEIFGRIGLRQVGKYRANGGVA
ncbi:hypothetical protein Asppvi_009010 [Aspergillus pseudoviridinutans]|uniref:Uncharacterized protein n=1 Tax=Aspergillus pseudoviridinutans TaxID=1517512 RepID=A0A9P3BEZ1_9EURO|nr:uncharacterized protein Asppvi_009010 [Aspergillus pseudoviridinutans]GIJ90061.1 hypothetical protein Asppvi_009010 [Aspergillus pseudoviridinutans]